MKISFLFPIILSFIFLVSCEKQTDNSDPIVTPDPDIELQGTVQDYKTTSISYGLNMLSDINDCGEENVLLSPYSLQTALYMTMNGSDGNTLEEFRTALNTGEFYPSGLNNIYKDLAEDLLPKGDNTSFQSSNAVFYSPSLYTPAESFQAALESNYLATFQEENFSDEGTVEIINSWVSDQTEQRIEKVIDKIEADEAIFLINALVFTADWEIGFEESATQDRTFTLSDGTELNIPTMQSDDQRRYIQHGDFSAVDLGVKDGDYSMTFILPNESVEINAFIQSFDVDQYEDLYQNLNEERVQIFLPKFEIATHKNMKDILVERGMTTAFESADLSRMGQFTGAPYISRVLHDAYLKIDEAGIEGAAVTTVGVGVESVPPTLSYNRPFVFIIRHIETNIPIFMGKVGNPTE